MEAILQIPMPGHVTWTVEVSDGARTQSWRVTVRDSAGHVLWDHGAALAKVLYPSPLCWLWSDGPAELCHALRNEMYEQLRKQLHRAQ